MVAHGARSPLLVKLLDMKMWDGSLIKYCVSSLVCPLSRTWEFTVNIHSSQPQDFLDPKNSLAWREHHDQIEFELASRWGKLESSLFLLLPTTRRQYYHRLHGCHGKFFLQFIYPAHNSDTMHCISWRNEFFPGRENACTLVCVCALVGVGLINKNNLTWQSMLACSYYYLIMRVWHTIK
jgi:hypothetical protein